MALDFDGLSDRIDFPSIFIPVGQAFSFACRFNLSALSGNEYFLLIESGASDFGFTVWLRDDAGQQGLAVTCSGANGSVLRYTIPQVFSINRWYGLVVTWNGSVSASGVHIYLDGIEHQYAGSTDGVAPLRSQDGNWIVAGRANDNLRNLSGRLADLGAWDKILSVGARESYFSGVRVSDVETANLVFDTGFIAGSVLDSVTLQSGTVVGSPIVYDHPIKLLDGQNVNPPINQSLGSIANSSHLNAGNTSISSLMFPLAQSLSASNVPNATTQIEVFDYYEGGNADTSRVVITDAETIAPTITLFARPNVNTEGAQPGTIYYSLACRLTGVLGKMPKLMLNLVDASPRSIYGNAGWPAGWRPWFSYDNDVWQRMDNSSVVGNFQEVSHSTVFTQDTVFFSSRPPYNPSRVRSHTDSIRMSPFVSEPNSSFGKDFVYAQTAATSRDGDGLAVPSLDLISYRVSDDASAPVDGSRKRVAVLMSGQHASEDQGNWQLQSFVDYLLGGTVAAGNLLRNWEFFVYPLVNPSGRWGNAYRGTLQANERDEDPNRDWPGGTTAGRLHVISATRLAIEKDTTNAINAFIDFHGRFRETDSVFRFPNYTNDSFIAYVNARYPVVSVESTLAGGVAETYYRSEFNVALSVTSEGSGFVASTDSYSLLGEALANGLNDSFEAGLFPMRTAEASAVLSRLSQATALQNSISDQSHAVVSSWW